MATLKDAIAAKALELYALPQWERRSPIRPLWFVPSLWDWVDETPIMNTKVGGKTLAEHVKQIMPVKHGIRKMHPAKLRIYGWCPGEHQFVAVTGALEADTKSDLKLNDKKRDEVLMFIRRNDLAGTVLLGDNRVVFPPQG